MTNLQSIYLSPKKHRDSSSTILSVMFWCEILRQKCNLDVFNSRHCSSIGKLSVLTVIIVEICINLCYYFYVHFHICITTLSAMLIHVYIVNNRAQGPEWPIAI